ncbi:tRNA uridine-5-carboxymethylaminomethyl(34) synthesis GTPase MnmE [Flavobacteriaceae bacterium]|nr:tRNA uridine-5-carboxymethylaminomethyl(34) synthesis GTPase MnmE [Flavobacteriaceae bacterium]MDC1060673.1 tRNA uridine-5-carboxymethylaminomethyl(34) synthesis GTPase MnmE [Flavobacteriaceae bacterium]
MIGEGTIIALSTASGAGAIAIIRLSGDAAIRTTDQLFRAKSKKKLINQKSHSIHLGDLLDGERIIDEVLVSVFKNPHSYTGEDVIEISCHGSRYIQEKILQLFVEQGIRPAKAGEFTLRAFMNGKMDLAQAEAVADVIASENEASHQVAMQQMRGGISQEIKSLRQELLDFASLIELELDFAEEDVAFADRAAFEALLLKIQGLLKRLIDSFALGNVIKKGVPIAIIGPPNAGKSTLLNVLLQEDKAIISAIAGTTRDSIEDEITIGGIGFRFIDTAGIRETQDEIEQIGIQKTFEKVAAAAIVLYLIDSNTFDHEKTAHQEKVRQLKQQYSDKAIWILFNKNDNGAIKTPNEFEGFPCLRLSAKNKSGINTLKEALVQHMQGNNYQDESIITNSRHYAALTNALIEIGKVQEGMENQLSSDLLAIDLRQALFHLGEITGEVTNDELLGNIFANFCIGK